MHRWLRNLHLFAGLFSAIMTLQYGLSTLFMSHRSWFGEPKPLISEASYSVPAGSAGSARSLALHLMDVHGLRGELRQGRETENGFVLRLALAGIQHDVEYSRASGQAKVKTTRRDSRQTLIAIHHMGGVRFSNWVNNAWGVLVGAVSVGLIVLAVSGIYLWFKLKRERTAGALILAASLVYSLTLIAILRNA